MSNEMMTYVDGELIRFSDGDVVPGSGKASTTSHRIGCALPEGLRGKPYILGWVISSEAGCVESREFYDEPALHAWLKET